MSGIRRIADGLIEEFKRVLPWQRKTQRDNLALLTATMLDVRSANLMDLAAALPRAAERADMRYQWIARVLGNRLIDPDAVMEPFARAVLDRAALADGQPVVLIMDQAKLPDRHQGLMLARRHGERALPLAWRVEATEGPIGFDVQRELLEAVASWLPEAAQVCLMADRFYGTADLISLCQDHGWDYRLRLKGNLVVNQGRKKTKTGALADAHVFRLVDVQLTAKKATTNIGIIRDPATMRHGSSPCRRSRAISGRWTTRRAGRSSRCSRTSSRAASASRTRRSCIPTASRACCSSWRSRSTAQFRPGNGTLRTIRPRPKKTSEASTEEGRALQNVLVHERPAAHCQTPPSRHAPTNPLVDMKLMDGEAFRSHWAC